MDNSGDIAEFKSADGIIEEGEISVKFSLYVPVFYALQVMHLPYIVTFDY